MPQGNLISLHFSCKNEVTSPDYKIILPTKQGLCFSILITTYGFSYLIQKVYCLPLSISRTSMMLKRHEI